MRTYPQPREIDLVDECFVFVCRIDMFKVANEALQLFPCQLSLAQSTVSGLTFNTA